MLQSASLLWGVGAVQLFYRVHFCTNIPTFSTTVTNNLNGILY